MANQTFVTPKYYQIAQQIIERIKKGELKPGSQIPSENEIIETYGVSNTTARKALSEMEREGWVSRIKGRGTYVRQNKIERSVSRILSFTKNMIEEGRNPSTELISLNMDEPTRTITLNHRKYTLETPICKIQRLRFGDNVPILFETRYISLHFCPDIYRKDLERSLYEIYEHEYELQLYEIRQVLSVTETNEEMMEYFAVDKPVPSFKVEGVTFCGKELILEIEESIYRGDHYQLTVTATQ